MIASKVWCLAQAIYLGILLTFCVYYGTPDMLLAMPFAVFFGLPALLLFSLWLRVLKARGVSGNRALWLSLLVMPLCTGLCSFGLAYLLGPACLITALAAVAVPATLLSVRICHKPLHSIAEI